MTDLRTAIFSALCACLDLMPESEEALAAIREAYNEPENSPRSPLDRDVVYWRLMEDVSAQVPPPTYMMNSGTSGGTQTPMIHTTLAASLLLIFYGPRSMENAGKVRLRLYLDGAGNPRSILRAAGIYPVPQPPLPLRLADQEGSLWRPRADLSIPLRIHITVPGPQRNAITIPPAITLHG